MLDIPGSDCGTKRTTTVEFSKDNMSEFVDRYIKEGNKLVLLDRDTAPKYFGKTVQMRSPMYCKSQKICNKCAGEFYYKLKVRNIGLLANTISSMLLNASLKAFHDMSLKPVKPDFSKYISEE